MRLAPLLIATAAITSACGTHPAREARKFVFHEYEESDIVEAKFDDALFRLGLHSQKGWTKLPVRIAFESGTPLAVRIGVERAGATWNGVAELELLRFEDDAQPFVGPLYDRLNDEVTTVGVEKRWCRTGKSTQVLGATIWDNDPADGSITDADVVFNGEFYDLGDTLALAAPDAPVVDIESLALHEFGHLLGLSHVSEMTSVMYPSLYVGDESVKREVSQRDVARLRYLYANGAEPQGEAFETPSWDSGGFYRTPAEPVQETKEPPAPTEPRPAPEPCDFPPF